MSCETANYLYNRCPDVISTNCITYQGDPIPCLGICKGTNLSTVEFLIADKVCKLATLTDMSVIDFTHKCPWIAQAWNSAHPGNNVKDNTILNILNFVLDELCVLNTKVDNLPNPLNNPIQLDYKCCGDICGVGSTLTIPNHLQRILDCLCSLSSTVNNLVLEVDSLSKDIVFLKDKINNPLSGLLKLQNDIVLQNIAINSLQVTVGCILNNNDGIVGCP